MKVGVLALQGDVREHMHALRECGAEPITVRRINELDSIDALIIPGGESTTVAILAETFSLFKPIQDRISAGLPVYGSCAGMILMADRVLDATEDQLTFGGLNIVVRRNAFGRQVDSFESDLDFHGLDTALRAVFIRAPWVEEIGEEVEVLASLSFHGKIHPVAVRQGTLLATSFHPELTDDHRLHRYFLEEVCRAGSRIG